MINIEEANEYFELHLKYSLWQNLDNQTKNAALHSAKMDVLAFLNTGKLDETDIFSYCAVFEQAIYLAEFFNDLHNPRQILGESIQGIGSVRYKETERPQISPRAAAFLERVTPPVQFGRG